jgi:hypothetical protein
MCITLPMSNINNIHNCHQYSKQTLFQTLPLSTLRWWFLKGSLCWILVAMKNVPVNVADISHTKPLPKFECCNCPFLAYLRQSSSHLPDLKFPWKGGWRHFIWNMMRQRWVNYSWVFKERVQNIKESVTQWHIIKAQTT